MYRPKSLAAFILVFFSFSSWSSDFCNTGKLLTKVNYLESESNDVVLSADKSYLNKGSSFFLEGNAEVVAKDYYFSANKIEFNKDKNNFSGNGDIKFQNSFFSSIGDSLSFDDDDISAKNVYFSFNDSKSNGKAKEITASKNLKTLSEASFTNCPIENNDWVIEAQKITIDDETNLGNAKNATLKFFGVPILYLPEFQWTLKGRGTGFLPPSFGTYYEENSNSNESRISIPYYFNLAKNKDLLLNVDNLSSRGPLLSAQYRHLLEENEIFKSGYLKFSNSFLENDKISNSSRWFSDNLLEIDFDKYSKFQVNLKQSSDGSYFNDLNKNNSEKSLLSSMELHHKKDELELSLSYENEQLLDGGESSYLGAPKLNVKKNFDFGENKFDITFNLVDFKNKDAQSIEGIRSHIESNFSRNFYIKKFQLNPRISLLHSEYNLDNNINYRRNVEKISLDASTELESNTTFGGQLYSHVIKPKFNYNFVSKNNQSLIPRFDSEKITLNSSLLYNPQKFTGLDRINNENSITFGFNSSFYDFETGNNILNTGISQKFNFDNETLNIDGNFSNQREFSNLFLDLDYFANFSKLESSIEFDPHNSKVVSSSYMLNLLSSPKKSFALNYVKDDNETVGLNAVYPISENVHLFGALSKELGSSITHKELMGFSYETCCWEFNVAKFSGDGNNSDNSLNFELVFKDLSSTSPKLKERIKSQIPNYLNENHF